jgi:hypothetical protein
MAVPTTGITDAAAVRAKSRTAPGAPNIRYPIRATIPVLLPQQEFQWHWP